ncbi:family 16 glycosylhydrolase [Saccharicrinis aurantiacus]|uniref:family 16 glycosylhydrolase n=1 Tax=Saccharicrinis aurantiacus TaxID=1849719 RepID=UPI00083897FA|nr:family 16 glycosylhydrolase [Saccharicrinis aurantiacus]
MGRYLVGLLCTLCFSGSLFAQELPLSHPDMKWEFLSHFSDEFDGATLDQKWTTDVRDWGTWAWESENTYVNNGSLAIRMRQKEKRSDIGKDVYFTSGIAQIDETITYGYFEARMKGSSKGQGTCPAFWLYSRSIPEVEEEGYVQYSEIDVIEIFQIPNKEQTLEMNLHTRIYEDGAFVWKRPGQGNTELCHNSWDAPWHPSDEYHTYGVMNRVDSIFWYVDGVQRGAKKNHYWHLPMRITVSMGLRTPYEKYIDGVRTIMPYPEETPEPGFPTEMYCDYVRVWEAQPQIIVDYEKYENDEFPINLPLVFQCYFDAGSGHEVIADSYNGIEAILLEKNAQGDIISEDKIENPSVIGQQGGNVTFSFDISSYDLTEDLPEGNYYEIIPKFTSSINEGTDIVLDKPLKGIKLVEEYVGIKEDVLSELSVFPNPASNRITVKGLPNQETELSLYNIFGGHVLTKTTVGEVSQTLSIGSLNDGVYLLKVATSNVNKVIKFTKGN